MGKPRTLWSSVTSDDSSSVYSQEQGLSDDVSPLISRKDSSSSSKASTTYSDNTVKSLGYKPFEYWKGPRPVAYPGENPKRRKQAAPVPSRTTTGINRSGPVNALHDFRPIPDAKIREVKIYLDAVPPGPRSPRVKDRYGQRQRERERARRKRQRTRAAEEWPGWIPDEKVYTEARRTRRVRMVTPDTKRDSDVPSLRERWWNPWTWRRRVWGIVVAMVMVVVIAAIIVATVVSKDNGPSYPNYKRLSYRLAETYNTEDFFDHFNYFTGPDPSNGFVHYASRTQAAELNLTSTSAAAAVLRVDASVDNTSVPDASTGRYSVRVASKRQFEVGGGTLFLLDVRHTPSGCGTWPALWLADPARWPAHGEMVVMEAGNLGAAGNAMTLHTSGGCDMTGRVRNMTGFPSAVDSCAGNPGCGVVGDASTFGFGFNAGGGGVMAVEWRIEGIRMWQFQRAAVPQDILLGTSPDPSSWGRALADFPGTGCDVRSHFRNQSILMNINLCGDFAEEAYARSGCPGSCADFVANDPDGLLDAFWELGPFKVYQAV